MESKTKIFYNSEIYNWFEELNFNSWADKLPNIQVYSHDDIIKLCKISICKINIEPIVIFYEILKYEGVTYKNNKFIIDIEELKTYLHTGFKFGPFGRNNKRYNNKTYLSKINEKVLIYKFENNI